MIISISGLPGSGKSTIGKNLAKKLGYNYYSLGDMKRRLANEKGLTIEEWNALSDKDSSYDTVPDKYQADLAKKEDNFIMDGRLAYHFIPQSIKIFLLL